MSEKEKWISGEKSPEQSDPDWDKKLITELATASLKEQRKSRRWGIFFKMLGFAYFTVILFGAYSSELFQGDGETEDHTAVVDVYGVIAADQPASADVVIKGLRDAFESDTAKAVILRINSPGGSPVQSGVIYDEIIRLREKHSDKPLYATIEDTCASGGYYIASAAEKIFADKASLVGSIGVRMDGFGFVDAIGKLGVERRLLTSGENKALLDPFTPINEGQVEHIKVMMDDIHQQFIDAVKSGRGDRLKDSPEVFSGLIWSGEQAVEMGLVDALGSDRSVARDIVNTKKMVNYTPQEDLLSRLAGKLGASISAGFYQTLETRLR